MGDGNGYDLAVVSDNQKDPMNPEDRRNVASLIEAHSRRVTVQQLAVRGTRRHIRGDLQQEGPGAPGRVRPPRYRQTRREISEETREAILQESKQQFDELMQLQARCSDAEAQLEEEREKTAVLEQQLEEAKAMAKSSTSNASQLEAR